MYTLLINHPKKNFDFLLDFYFFKNDSIFTVELGITYTIYFLNE